MLHTLPVDDPRRNCPLKDIGAQIRNRQGNLWRDCSTWKIGRVSFNQLGEVWTTNNEFRCPTCAGQHPAFDT